MIKIGKRNCYLAVIAALFAFGPAQTGAEELRAKDVVRALAPTVTRSLSSGPATPEQTADEAFVNSVRDHGQGALSASEVDHLDKIVAQRKDLNVEMKFDFNSAALTGKNLKVAHELGKGLASPELKDQTFLIMGHTDATGSDLSNQKLSERRSAWVKDFLVTQYQIPADRLVAVGYGETHPKNPRNPDAAENRRVQVVNIMAYKAANK